jgi:AcrR family transcriptional regulator
MGRPALTDDQVAAFRQRACEVAMRLFRDEGYHGFSLRTLAAELDCSHATPYRYFADKAELFAAVRAEGFRQFEAFLRARLAGVADPTARMYAVSQAYFDFAGSQPAAFTVIFAMGQPQSDAYPSVAKAAADAWGVLLDEVRGAVRGHVLAGDVAELAHVLWAGIHGVASLHLAQKLPPGQPGAALVTSMMHAFLRAYRAEPAVAPARARTGASLPRPGRTPRSARTSRTGAPK